ncbi:hypothetical protein H6503_05330 [Candidatus Woesearchaeota archaeon]|nr:hypothetical protein [Candidatus Woesearchaeota archaeon]
MLTIAPEPTKEMYNNDRAFNFISSLMNDASYTMYIMVFVFVVSAVLLWIGYEALAAILIAPITVNIVAFHLFLDGIFMPGAVMGNVLLLINVYLIWVNWKHYKGLFEKG